MKTDKSVVVALNLKLLGSLRTHTHTQRDVVVGRSKTVMYWVSHLLICFDETEEYRESQLRIDESERSAICHRDGTRRAFPRSVACAPVLAYKHRREKR